MIFYFPIDNQSKPKFEPQPISTPLAVRFFHDAATCPAKAVICIMGVLPENEMGNVIET